MAKGKEAIEKSLKGKQAIGKSFKGKEVIGKSSSGKRKSDSKPDDSGNASGSKKKRFRGLKFVDDEALDADYEEEEDLNSDENDSDDSDSMDDLSEERGSTNKTGKLNVLPFLVKSEEEDLENFIKERYSHVVYADDSQDVKGLDDRMCAMHSMKDPVIWKVKCVAGREQQLAVCLMQKFLDLQDLNTKLQIISAFAIDHLKGCIFVEAEKESDVIEACKGYCNVYTSRISLISHSEVPHLLSVQYKPCGLSEGMWVHIKNGNYKGDLGQVVAVEEHRKRALIKLTPRIDLQAMAKKFGGGMSLKQTPVPAPRLIRSDELEDFRSHIERKRDRLTGEVFEVLDGMMLKEGFLYKKVSLGSLSYWNVQPSVDEDQRFKMKTCTPDDLDWLSELYEGRGKVCSVHLTEKKDGVSGTKNERSFVLNDFVFFGQKDFGVIIGVEGEAFKIIKGAIEATEVVNVKLQEIKKKLCDKVFTATDSRRTTIAIGDTVRVLSGPFEGREGFLRHLYRGTIFIQDNSILENSGYFCTKSELCEKINLKGTCKAMQEVKQPSGFLDTGDSPFQPEKGSSGHRGQCRSFQSNYRGEGDRFSIGQTLRIRVGPLKGHLCCVVALHRYDLTVKLLSQSRVIKVSHDHVSEPKNLSENSFGQVTNGGLKDDSDKGFGSPKETSELPSHGRDICNFSSSSFDSNFAKTLDNIFSSDVLKTGEIIDGWAKVVEKAAIGSSADPWVRKSNQIVGPDETTDGWVKPQLCSGADRWGKSNQTDEPNKAPGAWGKVALDSNAAVGSSADPWLSKSNQAGESTEATDGWGKKAPVGSIDDHWASKSNDAGGPDKATNDWKKAAVGSCADTWVSKSSQPCKSDKATDGWGKKAAVGSSADTSDKAGEPNRATEEWEKPRLCSGADRWGKSNQIDEPNKAPGGWGKVALDSSAAVGSSANPWLSKSNQGGESEATDDWGKKATVGSIDDHWASESNDARGSDKATDDWKKAAVGSCADTWVSKSSQPCKSDKATDGWGKRAGGGTSTEATDGREKAAGKQADQSVNAPGWDKAAFALCDNPWGKKVDHVSYSSKSVDGSGSDNPLTRDKADSWSRAVDGNDVKKSWDDSSQENVWMKSTMGYCAGGGKNTGQCGGWGDAAKDEVRQERSQNNTNNWNRSNSFGGQQGLGWNKASEGDHGSGFNSRGTEVNGDGWGGQSGGWNKMGAFEGGRGFGGRRGGRGGRGGEGGEGERGRGGRGWRGESGGRRGRGDYSGRGRGDYSGRGRGVYSGRGRGDFSSKGRFSGPEHSGQNQDLENNLSGGGGIPGGGWNDCKGDGSQANIWNKGAYFEGGRSEFSNFGEKQSDGTCWSGGQASSNWNKKASDKDDGSSRLEKWSSENSYGCGTSTNWKRERDSFERDPNSSWQKSNYCGGGDSVGQGGRGDNGWRGGRRGGGRGGSGFGRGRGRGFCGEPSSSGWNNSDKGGFGENGSSGWNKGEREVFGGNGSSGRNNNDRGCFVGNGSSSWKNGEGGLGDNVSSGWKNGGNRSSGWNNGDCGGFGGNKSSSWKNGGGYGGNESSGWNNGGGGGSSGWKNDGAFGGNESSGWNSGGSGGNDSSGWNNGDGGDFGGNRSSGRKNGDGGFDGNESSGWNNGKGVGSGGNSSGWKNGDGGFGGNESSGWSKGDREGFCGKGVGSGGNSSGWKNGDGGFGGNESSGWSKGDREGFCGSASGRNHGDSRNEDEVKADQKDPWEKVAGSWGKGGKGGW